MIALRLAFRAYRDFYDQIWWLLLVVTIWWLLLLTPFAPPATLLLFQQADPRQGAWDDRLGFRGFARYLLGNFVRGWKLFLIVIPILGLLTFNLVFYGSSDSALASLSIIWLMLLVMGITAAVVIVAVAGTTGLSASESLKIGCRLAALRLPAAILVLLITGVAPVLIIFSVQFLLPLVLAVPGVVAIAFSGFVLKALRVAIPEPNKPTDERLHEKRT